MAFDAGIPANIGNTGPIATVSRWLAADDARLLSIFIVAHVVVWTIAMAIMRLPGALWDDMLETYSWSQHWQLGYYKHPPFYSWVVAVWFKVFPRQDWAFYLLSAVNVGIGFAGVWKVAGQFVKRDARLLAVLSLAFIPSYNYLASNFNANTILISLWPWTAYAFVRSLETRSLGAGIAFGIFAAAGMLSKYYSALLLASCFAAAVLHPAARRYFSSPAPYAAVITAALLFAPHLWWSFVHDWPTIKYAMGKTGNDWASNFQKAAGTGIAGVAINFVPAAILIWALRRHDPDHARGAWERLWHRDRLWLFVLALGPTALTLLLGLFGYVKVSIGFLIPAFFMLPMLMMIALEPAITHDTVRSVGRVISGLFAGALLISPVVAYVSFYYQIKGTSDVSAFAVRDAATKWRDSFSVPLRIVAGSEKYSIAQPFYGPDNPVEFTHFQLQQAPWISPQLIAKEGILTICDAADTGCIGFAEGYANANTKRIPATIKKKFGGMKGPAVPLVYIMTPPAP